MTRWEYLKEHITDLRDANGKASQKETCQFILNLMDIIEKDFAEANDVSCSTCKHRMDESYCTNCYADHNLYERR